VDLVASLSAPTARAAPPAVAPLGPLRLTDYCGFLTLDEARAARDRLRGERIRSEIVIRESTDAALDRPAREEYWLRVDVSRLRDVASVLGDVPEVEEAAAADGAGFACGACGGHVAEDATRCPSCGARFDD
jgi:hypothetical protein